MFEGIIKNIFKKVRNERGSGGGWGGGGVDGGRGGKKEKREGRDEASNTLSTRRPSGSGSSRLHLGLGGQWWGKCAGQAT